MNVTDKISSNGVLNLTIERLFFSHLVKDLVAYRAQMRKL